MTCVPAARAEVLTEAVPTERAKVPRSVLVVLSTKSTLPVGVAEPGRSGTTVAVNVTT